MMEGSGSVPHTNGSDYGSGRTKNLRIRLRNNGLREDHFLPKTVGLIFSSICHLSRSVDCNFVRDGNKLKGGGRAPPNPHQPGLIFPSWWDVRHKSAIASLRLLCDLHYEEAWVCLELDRDRPAHSPLVPADPGLRETPVKVKKTFAQQAMNSYYGCREPSAFKLFSLWLK